ncbi:MAG TPA: phytanoyl-CoA dioxygenase family protein [Longimicrobiaceae bacterium]|nr:phytanoyl-CoA dioxygenase family protein [Longimicrobiaceae bacterium]
MNVSPNDPEASPAELPGSPAAAAPAWLGHLEAHGYALAPDVLAPDQVDRVTDAVAAAAGEGVRRRESVYAIRNLLEVVPEVRALARSEAVRALVRPVLGEGCFAVRGILFDKTPDANWKVTWHQDLSIAVRERREVAGFGPWSEKAGVAHVQPPAAVLERMLTVRLHLDPCGPENGPVNVLPGSHAAGRLDADGINGWRSSRPAVPACSGRGGALLMRPLLLHASSPASVAAHRRVVHLEFAADELPGGLEWHGRW